MKLKTNGSSFQLSGVSFSGSVQIGDGIISNSYVSTPTDENGNVNCVGCKNCKNCSGCKDCDNCSGCNGGNNLMGSNNKKE